MNHLLAQALTLPGGTSSDPNVVKGVLPPLEFRDVGHLVGRLYYFALPLMGIGLLIVILISGFMLLTSAGDAKKMEKGKQTLTYGVVGFLIVFLAYWITQLLGFIFGFESIGEIFK